jgi:hypothetical protein
MRVGTWSAIRRWKSVCTGCRIHHTRRDALKRQRGMKPTATRFYHPLIGPRVRLPQAKDVPEGVILEVLRKRPGKWHTHWPIKYCPCYAIMPSLGCAVCCPELATFPAKVVWAKLCSMSRRGLIEGGGCGVDCRGDWHVRDAR